MIKIESPEDAFRELQDVIMEVEDEFAKVCAVPAWLEIYEYKDDKGQAYKRFQFVPGSKAKLLKMPVARLGFSGEHLQVQRLKSNGKEVDCVDVLALTPEDIYLLRKIIEMLPAMHERLIADASVDIKDVLRATEKVQAWLESI